MSFSNLHPFHSEDVPCAGACCQFVNKQINISPNWSTLYLGSLIDAGLLLLSVLYLIGQLYRSYAKLGRTIRRLTTLQMNEMSQSDSGIHDSLLHMQHDKKSNDTDVVPLLSIYYVYSLAIALWFSCEAVILVLPGGSVLGIIGAVFYVGHSFLDNAILIFMFFPDSSKKSIYGTIVITLVITISKGVVLIIYSYVYTCSWCPIFFPSPTSLFTYLAFTIFYTVIIVSNLYLNSSAANKRFPFLRTKFTVYQESHHSSSDPGAAGEGYYYAPKTHVQKCLVMLKSRTTLRMWAIYLFVVYFVSFVASVLAAFKVDFGFCIMIIIIYAYITFYVPLLFKTFKNDSRQLYYMRKHAIGLADFPRNNYIEEERRLILEDSLRKKMLEGFGDEQIELIEWKNLKIGKKIGIGGYGEVFKAVWEDKHVAVKRFLNFEKSDLNTFKKEIEMMSKLRHPNVVLFLGVVIENHAHYCIVTEFMDRGSVYNILHNHRFVISPEHMKRIALQSARGMQYLHSRNPPVIHRDLKSMNLLIDSGWNVKICDFGLSRLKLETATMSRIGTVQWVAPEILRDEKYNELCDVFSFAIILWELTTLEIPFHEKGAFLIANEVAYKNERLRIPSFCDKHIKQLIERCWSESPHDRPKFEEIFHIIDKTSAKQWREKKPGEGIIKKG